MDTSTRLNNSKTMENKIPILKIGDILLVSIQVDLHDRLALALQEQLSEAISINKSKGVMIDISALEIVDSFIGRVLGGIAKHASLLDARVVVVGMRPAVAITMVELGISLKGVQTALNPEAAMAILHSNKNGNGTGNSKRF